MECLSWAHEPAGETQCLAQLVFIKCSDSFAILSCVFRFVSGICVSPPQTNPISFGAFPDEPAHAATWLADRPSIKHSSKPKNESICQKALSFFWEILLAHPQYQGLLARFVSSQSADCSGFPLRFGLFTCHCFCFCVYFDLFPQALLVYKTAAIKSRDRVRSVLKGCMKQIRKIGWHGCRGRYADWTSGDDQRFKNKTRPQRQLYYKQATSPNNRHRNFNKPYA